MTKFDGKILILGCGSVAQCTLAILFDVLAVDPKNITVIDAQQNSGKITSAISRGVQFRQERITKQNYQKILTEYLRRGDLLLDLSVEIGTLDLLQWCRDHDILFVNTSIEVWDSIEQLNRKSPYDQTLYSRHLQLHDLISSWKGGPTAIVEHGANPGLVSHFVKQALVDIAQEQTGFDHLIEKRQFAKLSRALGVKAIHISEIDTQISSIKKMPGEFVNTWSCDGFIEEAIAPAELGWGTHEKAVPSFGVEHTLGPRHQIFLKKRGLEARVKTAVPSCCFTGMIVRHGEAGTMCEALSVYEKGKAIYRPTVHYAYQPCSDALASLQELVEQGLVPQPRKRILGDDIIEGRDELGCLLMGDFGAWWVGSIMTIEEARRLAPHQNATTVQVAIGVVAAMVYAIEDQELGVVVPDELNHERILKTALPYLGEFLSKPISFKVEDWQFSQAAV